MESNKMLLVQYSNISLLVGHAEGEGIRSAVSEAGDQLIKR